MGKKYLEFKTIKVLIERTNPRRGELFRLGMALLFIIAIMFVCYTKFAIYQNGTILVIAAMIGGYMGLNIGANDVANNVGPAVGSKAISLTGAILIAAICEASGALVAGGDVVSTIKKEIIDSSLITDANTFIWIMMSALLAAAIWLNLATAIGAPVSTTHSIVGGVLGAGVAAAGWGIANWPQVGAIIASWVISPIMGGIIAAAFLLLIKKRIIYQSDMVKSARVLVPILISAMVWAFVTYLILKGLNKIWQIDILSATVIGFVFALAIYFIVKQIILHTSKKMGQDRERINKLFTIPLVFAAALLSFAHGANDVANAVGPLAAINDAVIHGGVVTKAEIPLWVMMVGAIGIVMGLALYGPKLIHTVGSEITKLDKIRAFCVAMAAAVTVILASQLGLPVSSTHIAVGGVFGVGFLREYLEANQSQALDEIRNHYIEEKDDEVGKFLDEFNESDFYHKGQLLMDLKKKLGTKLYKKDKKKLRKVYRTELVKRSILVKIVAAWLVTVPSSGGLAAVLYFILHIIFLK